MRQDISGWFNINLSGSSIRSGKATHPRISAFIAYIEATPSAFQPNSTNIKCLSYPQHMQLLFLPRKTCSSYSLLDSRLLQQFVKEGTSEMDQLQADSALQDTEQKTHKFFKQHEPSWYNQFNTASTENC